MYIADESWSFKQNSKSTTPCNTYSVSLVVDDESSTATYAMNQCLAWLLDDDRLTAKRGKEGRFLCALCKRLLVVVVQLVNRLAVERQLLAQNRFETSIDTNENITTAHRID